MMEICSKMTSGEWNEARKATCRLRMRMASLTNRLGKPSANRLKRREGAAPAMQPHERLRGQPSPRRTSSTPGYPSAALPALAVPPQGSPAPWPHFQLISASSTRPSLHSTMRRASCSQSG